jgi:hypothetical protein
VGRAGKQADGSAKRRLAYRGGVFTQHQTDEEGPPVRDYESTTYVSSFSSIEAFGPCLRQDAIGRRLALALPVGSRGKQSGLFWGEPGAENVLALRCLQSSRRLGEFWKERLNTHAARNDRLALAV